jgi:hypothetical protein
MHASIRFDRHVFYVLTRAVLPATFGALTLASLAQAHFVFVIADEEGTEARVILSETLEVDENIDPELVDGVKLVTRDGAGAEGALTLARDGETRLVKLPEKTRGAIHGTLTHGIMKHGPVPFLVVYHPKACLGYPFGSAARIGGESPAEIVPAGHPGAVRFQLLSRGEPVADAKMIVLLPDGKQQEVVTDAKGHTPLFDQAGRYGAWARHVVATPGEHGGEADGSVHRLAETGCHWQPVASVVPRIVHRAVADGDEHLVLVGGAAHAENLDLDERVPVKK